MDQDARDPLTHAAEAVRADGRPAVPVPPRPGPAPAPSPRPGPPSAPVEPDAATGALSSSDDSGSSTGDDAVDSALEPLGALAGRPVREHVAVFDALHGALSDRLAETRE